MSHALAGGIFETPSRTDDLTDLRQLVDDIGSRSFEARIGNRGLPDSFDAGSWRHLEDAGLTRLTSTGDSGGGPAELALILRGLARHAVTVPVGETDLLAGWLAARAGLDIPDRGPLAVAIGEATEAAISVPYADCVDTIIFALRRGDELDVKSVRTTDLDITVGHNLGGEPLGVIHSPSPHEGFVSLGGARELITRGAWIRCMQIIGALDAAMEFTAGHCRDRVQFGRSLSAFQSVQHTLAFMAGEIERARAAATLAVVAAVDYGFDSTSTDYAVTVAKVVLGQVVPAVCKAAHQLHGAIGVTKEHHLWLATMRAQSWITDFGDTVRYAQRLGRLALDPSNDLWDLVIGQPSAAKQC